MHGVQLRTPVALRFSQVRYQAIMVVGVGKGEITIAEVQAVRQISATRFQRDES